MDCKSNMDIADNCSNKKVEIYYDYSSKKYGIRECQVIIHDGVFITTKKSIDMTRCELESLIHQAKYFLRER